MTEGKLEPLSTADESIDFLKNDTLKLANLIIRQFKFLLANLNSDDIKIMQQLRDFNDQFNAFKIHVNQKFILYFSEKKSEPIEIRIALSIFKIINDFGLINDEIKLIVRHAEIYIIQNLAQKFWSASAIDRCAILAIDIIKNAMHSLSLLDAHYASQSIHLHERASEEYNLTTVKLMNQMENGPRSISLALDILYIAKSTERLAKHAKNISQQIIDIIGEFETYNTAHTEPLEILT